MSAQENPRRRSFNEEDDGSPRKLMKFDGSNEHFFDVVLLVKDERFYVLKAHLAQHSPIFYSMFFRDYAERDKKEIELNEVEPNYFQNFLELINGESCLEVALLSRSYNYQFSDENIEGVLKLSRMYLAATALRACQLFLIEKSEIPKKRKLELALEYQFNDLKKTVIASITTKADLEKVIPTDIDSWDADTIKLMFQRSLNIFEVQQPVQEPVNNVQVEVQAADTVPVVVFRERMLQFEMIIQHQLGEIRDLEEQLRLELQRNR
ncbi:hypothetical protein CAEBREN_16770 [Caenorhabditis brenneri]|uniref:BTB domain-containing protein n=1 Tax=Caenorhabditis brenneri TaxID=135651 RepID=G0MV06_CAEBE|nr:hypothetical protein CAEBREN_16770 [Caenorhabditis brenneri]